MDGGNIADGTDGGGPVRDGAGPDITDNENGNMAPKGADEKGVRKPGPDATAPAGGIGSGDKPGSGTDQGSDTDRG